MPTIFKSMPMEIKANNTGNLVFKISTKSMDRDEDIMEPMGCDLTNYRNNPVVLFAHDYSSPPIGKSLRESIYPEYIESEVQFAPTAFAQDCKKLCEGGFLNAASVGFNGVESEPIQESKWGKRYKKWELLEWSIVPVPANATCLVQGAKAKGLTLDAFEKELENMEIKTVIPYKKYPLADEAEGWDGPAEISAASVENLKIMCAWYDSDNADAKQAYKLPHHKQDGYTTVWRAVSAAMGALLGARGGVQIPDAERKGVYNHLAKHYKDFDKEPPEFKEYAAEEMKEVTLLIDTNLKEVFACESGVKIAKIKMTDEYYAALIEKSGAAISSKNRVMLNEICESMKGCGERLRKFIDDTSGMMEDEVGKERESNGVSYMTCEDLERYAQENRSAELIEIKTALEEIKSQVLSLCPKNANKDIDLDAIEFVKSSKPLDEPGPDELRKMISEKINTYFKEEN
ncbi:MAG: HK97 family phage prohead protease [Phycisphaerae bacterium]|jgi:phage head maturation protease